MPDRGSAASSTCLLDVEGVVSCWGPRGSAPRGPRRATDRARAIAVGMFASCALRSDPGVVCWDALDSRWTVELPEVRSLAVGYERACAVHGGGDVTCWDAVLGRTSPAPPRRAIAVHDATAVAVGMIHACALRRDGTVACWGGNDSGELGDGTRAPHAEPAPVVGVAGAVEIAAGTYYGCARLGDGSAVCWGGLGGDDGELRPVAIPAWTGAVQLSLNAGCNAGKLLCARMPSGAVRCFGDNDAGALGDGTRAPRRTPVEVQGLTDAVDLAVGCAHVCALRASGEVACWGDGEVLGFGRGHDQLVPAPARDRDGRGAAPPP